MTVAVVIGVVFFGGLQDEDLFVLFGMASAGSGSAYSCCRC